MRTLELRFHAHCCHCGEEMPFDMDKTVSIADDHIHWLVTPCRCIPNELEKDYDEHQQISREVVLDLKKRIKELKTQLGETSEFGPE